MADKVVGQDSNTNEQKKDPQENLLQGIPQPPPLPLDKDMIGAIKIKDALFIGDELAAQDLEFVVNNKVTHVINCSGRQIANHWEPIGVAYLTFYWLDLDNQVLFDKNDKITTEILNFIEEAHANGESVLVHSNRGQSRASAVLAVYFMQKYRWTLFKTLEFLNSRRPDLEIRAAFINQLSEFERRLTSQGRGPESGDWNEIGTKSVSNMDKNVEKEELLLRNTFLNAQMGPIALYKFDELEQKKNKNKLTWVDNGKNLRTNASEDDLIFKENPAPITSHKVESVPKPIIKPQEEPAVDEPVGNANEKELNFYKQEKELDKEIEVLETDLKPMNTEDHQNKPILADQTNYDPIVGNKMLGNTMPLPQKNNLIEKRAEAQKQEGCKKKPKHERKIKHNYIIENKKKVRKESNKRKRSAKPKESDKRLARDTGLPTKGMHRKSYSEVVRDTKKKVDKFSREDSKKKDVVINWQNVYNFNIQNSQLVNSKNASVQYFSGTNKSGKSSSSAQSKISSKNKQELFEKGLKKYSQGYTVNKLAKEGLLNRKE